MLIPTLGIGAVIGAALLVRRWKGSDLLEAARELRAGTSPIHRRPKLSEKYAADDDSWSMKNYHIRQARDFANRRDAA